jgi:hypothetical protein
VIKKREVSMQKDRKLMGRNGASEWEMEGWSIRYLDKSMYRLHFWLETGGRQVGSMQPGM